MSSQPRNLRSAREIARPDILFAVARAPDSDTLLVASSDGKVHELNAWATNSPDRELAGHGRYVTSVRLAGRMAISGGYDGRLIWWDRERRQVVRTVEAHQRWIRNIAVSPDGTKVASVGDDMVGRLWSVATGERLHELRGHAEQTPTGFATMLYACAFSADGSHLATGDRVGHVIVWDVETGRQLAAVDAPLLYTWDGTQRIRSIGGVRGLAFSPDGTHLAVGGVGQINNVDALAGPARVEIFNWSSRERVLEFTGQNGIVNRLVYHPAGDWLCAIGGGGNGLIMFYDTARRNMIHQGNVAMHVHDLAFNEDQTALYAVGHNKIVILDLQG
jgi:WD40 repeat protein